MRKTSFIIVLLAALALPGTAVRAQENNAAAAAESPEYQQAVEAALEEYRLQHYEEARSLFERAHALDPNARTLRGLGMVEFELRHYVRAAQLLEASLASQQKPLTEDQRKAVEDLLGRTRQFIALYDLKVEPEPAAFTVEIDGHRVDLGPQNKLSLEAGEHSLRISAPNAKPQELRIDVKGGEQQTIHIQLQVNSAPPPAAAPVAAPSNTRRRAAWGLIGAGGAVRSSARPCWAASPGSRPMTRPHAMAPMQTGPTPWPSPRTSALEWALRWAWSARFCG